MEDDKYKRQQRFKLKNKKDRVKKYKDDKERTPKKTRRPKFYFDPDGEFDEDFLDELYESDDWC